jgi:carboxymethylenebutenolidase
LAVAPAIFDRFEPGLELGYGPEDLKKAFSIYPKLNPDVTLLDVAAAYAFAAKASGKGTGVLGFCYGGLVTWLAATRGETFRMQPGCCVGYYPGGVGKVAAEQPSCPVMLHFGGADDHIGSDQIEAVRSTHPDSEVEIFVYDGVGHAFANPDRPSYSAAAAKLADERSLAFLKANLA